MAFHYLILTKIMFQSCNLVREVMLSSENAQQRRLEMHLIFQLVTSHPRVFYSDFRFLYSRPRLEPRAHYGVQQLRQF